MRNNAECKPLLNLLTLLYNTNEGIVLMLLSRNYSKDMAYPEYAPIIA